MPKKSKSMINWYPPRTCWRKSYRGKTYYLGTGNCKGEGDTEGYTAALQEFFEIKKRVDMGVSGRPERIRFHEPNPIRPSKLDITDAYCAFNYARLREANGNGTVLPQTVSKESSLDELVAAYLREHERRVAAGDLAHASQREMKECLKHFQDFSKSLSSPLSHPSKVDLAPIISEFREINLEIASRHQKTKRRPGVNEISFGPEAAKRHLAHLKRFILWIYEREIIDNLPRILNKDYAKVAIPQPIPKPFSKEELNALWRQAITFHPVARRSYRNALYVLLGLNCGMRSVDISTLRHEHLKIVDGRMLIVRERKKTGQTQIHRLWPLTEKLLKMEMTDAAVSKLVLLNERGGELVTDGSGDTKKNDSIGRAWFRLTQKLGWNDGGKGHSVLRKTSAQLLRDKGYEQSIINQFLAHSNKEMSKHYEKASIESRAKLFDAIDHLDAVFDLYAPALI
jgi:integrase